jgi:hypothetical protein
MTSPLRSPSLAFVVLALALSSSPAVAAGGGGGGGGGGGTGGGGGGPEVTSIGAVGPVGVTETSGPAAPAVFV